MNSGNWRSDLRFFSGCDDDTIAKLRDTRARRYIAENLEAESKAAQNAAVLAGSDISQVIRHKQVKTRASIEREMVSIEKTHSQLAASGNIPGDLTGFEATILGSNSISPSSSISHKEIVQCKKELSDSKAQIECLAAILRNAGIDVPHSPESDRAHNRAMDIWTDNTENRQKFDEMYSEYDLVPGHAVGAADDKVRVIPYRTEYV